MASYTQNETTDLNIFETHIIPDDDDHSLQEQQQTESYPISKNKFKYNESIMRN